MKKTTIKDIDAATAWLNAAMKETLKAEKMIEDAQRYKDKARKDLQLAQGAMREIYQQMYNL